MPQQPPADSRGDAVLLQPDSERTETHPRPGDDSSAAARTGWFTPGTLLAGRYRIVSPLGSGGAGQVYRAEDTKLGHAVALKFITHRIAHERELLERIISEVRIGRQVAHPNLCRIYDMGEIENQYFITMEYVDGENLASLLRRVGRLADDKAIQIAREICSGLAAAHDRGVVHRDMKPSNVMIDGRGHARITDFGLAVLPGEPSADFAGTPAYMAPEQLDGAEATEQSDIYSLGLVLYELFTGERVFSGTLMEISAAHARLKRPPTTIIRGFSPAIERVILQCLDEEPSERPESVRDVLAALPGGDLRAAIDAGETPSPRAVAAAERVGDLSLPVGWAAALAMITLIATIAAVSRYTTVYRQAPLTMSPAVLAERARQIIREAGDEPHWSGSRSWMTIDINVLREAGHTTRSLDRAAAFHRLNPLRFGYRESPRPLIPQGRGAIVNASDPPFDVPGMTSVTLDSRGHLVQFVRLPVASNNGGKMGDGDWKAFFSLAAMDEKLFKPLPAAWISPVDHDMKFAWTGTQLSNPPLVVDVRAAALAGRPVFFEQTVRLRDRSGVPEPPAGHSTAGEEFTRVGGFAAVFLAGALLAAVVARRNIRLGRGDRSAARKVSVLVFLSLLASGLLSADHTPAAGGEWALLVGMTGNALYHACAIWLFYIAAEPYVRRRQPELLISWNRILRGLFRDPLVGRHVLIGALLGALINLSYVHLLVLVPSWLGMTPPLPAYSSPEKLAGGTWPLVSLTALLGSVPRDAVLALFIFSAVRSVVRNVWIAAAATTVVSAIPHFGRDMGSLAEVPFVLVAAAVFVFALCRVGLLTGMVALFVGSWFAKSLFVFDPASWLFVPSLFYVGVALAITYYGFRCSLGPRPLFGRVRIAE